MKVCIELFTNSEISYMIDTKNQEITLKSETKKHIQHIKEKSQWNCTSCYTSVDMQKDTRNQCIEFCS